MQNRRTLLSVTGSGALASLLLSTRQSIAQPPDTTAAPPNVINKSPTDPFILLLRGIYVPITTGPDLGLEDIDLNDGSYSRTRIYPVFGIPSADNEHQNENDINVNRIPVGNFYVQLALAFSSPSIVGIKCAHQLPEGAIAQKFTSAIPFSSYPDGVGGNYLEGTQELDVTDATGIYKDFKGGHNHMVDRLHQLASGRYDEFCFCHISQYPYPAPPASSS